MRPGVGRVEADAWANLVAAGAFLRARAAVGGFGDVGMAVHIWTGFGGRRRQRWLRGDVNLQRIQLFPL